ncbi:DUF6352 family protein [soil metagenome]
MHDFWPACGYGLMGRTPNNHLVVSDDFLRLLLETPELAPISDSCFDERATHEALLADPRRPVLPDELARIRDEDARDNYAVWLRFRARLLAQPSLEASYLALFQGEGVDVPPAFVQHLTQVLVRHVLGNAASPFEARAAEMLFRTQKISVMEDGAVMAADDETVERHAVSAGFGSIGELLKQGAAPVRSADLDVLGEANADAYWDRDEAHDLVVSLNYGQPTVQALCRVLERWIGHFLGVKVQMAIDRQIDDELWVWHVGLDAQATGVLNDLYTGVEVGEERMARLLCLFKLDFADAADMRADVAGRPVYLAMAMDEHKRLKLKPQNLLLNLPLARRS